MDSGEGSPVQSQYDQEEKRECRKKLIRDAVKSLTTERETSVCVLRDHVRKAWQEFREKTTFSDMSFEEQEITEIEEDITDWERFHDSKVQTRKPSDLRVCYLAGDNPLNDFEVFLEKGVLPQNMWTIEKDRDTLEKALDSIGQAKKVPNFFKGDFLDFLKELNGQFDIIYFDACGSLPSQKQETLKAIGYVFHYHKLTSPGALITTFSFPPKQTEGTTSDAASPQDKERNHLRELSMEYLKYRLVNTSDELKIPCFNETFLQERTDEENYSEYIVYQIIDTAYMYIPAHRMLSSKRNSLLEQSFVNKKELLKAIKELFAPPLMKKWEDKASELLMELEKLDQHTNQIKELNLAIKEKKDAIEYAWLNFSRALAAASMTDNLEDIQDFLQIQELERELEEEIRQLHQDSKKLHAIQLQTESKEEELRQDYQEKLRNLSLHEAQPPRNLSQQASSMTERQSNPFCVSWIKEVFPDWKSTELKKWEILLLLMTHLLTNWVSLIDKCSNPNFKHCLELIKKSLGGDVEDARWKRIFSKFVDEPNKEITTQMIATLLYGQMANPSFPVLEKLSRLEYTARKRQMFSNLFIFDTCRYVYEQFPSVLTSTSVARPHKQMVFRMAVDGLRKHLRHICEEDVFKCCNVVEQVTYERVSLIPDSSRPTTQQPHDDLQHDGDSSSEHTTQQPHDDLQHDSDSSSEHTTQQPHDDLQQDSDSSSEHTTQQPHDDLQQDSDSSSEHTTQQPYDDLQHDSDSSSEHTTQQPHDDLPQEL